MKLEIKIINVIRDVSVWLKKEEKRIGVCLISDFMKWGSAERIGTIH